MKDITYAASFDSNDYQPLLKYAKKVRETHDQELVDSFNLACQNKWNDHANISINGMELLGVSKSDDLVVSAGTTQLINQILGASVVRWQFIEIGSGVTAPSAAQTTLVTPVGVRIDMSLFGWREYASSTLKFAGIFGKDHSIATINECGIFTTLTAGTMLNRNMFSNASIFTGTTFTCVFSSIIEFVPIV